MGKNFVKKTLIPLIISILLSLLVIFLSRYDLLKIIELKSLDQRYIHRFHPVPKNKDIIIVGIDDESLSKNQKPLLFWGKEFANVIKKLSENDVKAIAMDYIQEIPVPENDEAMQEALGFKKTILLTYINYTTRDFITPPPVLTLSVIDPKTMKADNNLGVGNIYYDLDGVYRYQKLLINDKSEIPHASLPLATVSKYLNFDLKGLTNEKSGLKLGSKTIPLINDNMYINFAGPGNTFPVVSFQELLENAQKNNNSYFKEKFAGKIALIGITSMSGRDFVVTPFNTMFTPTRMTGIELHANTINTILENNYIYKVPKIWINSIIILFSILICLACTTGDFTKGTIVSIVVLLLFIAISFLAFNFSNIWMDTIAPALSILFSFGGTSIYNYILMGREKRQIKNIFERFVSAPVVQKMLADPDSVTLGGQKKEITVLFSDINGFTTVSEKTSPDELITLLNSYFSVMTDVILETEGTLKQFVGDEIMVIYGAPLEQPDHAERALNAGIKMLKKLDELREMGEMDIKIKIGINTGEAVLGNVGSSRRMEYAAVGDCVNLAARIMELNKEFSSSILISEDTYKKVGNLEKDGIKFTPMTPKKIKGKTGEYITYEVKHSNQ